jgi:hypothetical protein
VTETCALPLPPAIDPNQRNPGEVAPTDSTLTARFLLPRADVDPVLDEGGRPVRRR